MSDPITSLNAALESRYRVERELGEGGMATVYLAEDLRHDRKVALKVLKPELAAVLGAERFLTEIKVTAGLQHPNILPLHDSGEADGLLFYVMPHVEGESLRERLDREKQLPVPEAIKLATEVAEALDHAHRRGVIHRDIKPANILLSDGRPLIADFGIALAVSAAGGGRMTETGLSVGTPFYMSPEQASADRELGAQSDVYSLGCVLYEMLVGEPPHTGPSAQAVLAKILVDVPTAPHTARATVPVNVDAAIRRALEKLPADRFASAAEFAGALADTGFRHVAAQVDAVTAAAPDAGPWRRRALAATAVAAVSTLALAWSVLAPESDPPLPVTRLDLDLGAVAPRDVFDDVVISTDGTTLAVSGEVDGETAIYVRRLGEADFHRVPDTDGGAYPSFSPDGQWIVFRVRPEATLVKVAVEGGGALTLYDGDAGNLREPHWGEDGTIVFVVGANEFGAAEGLLRISATGGEAERLPVENVGRHPRSLPDGSGVLVVVDAGIAVFDLTTGSLTPLPLEGTHPTYVETGHILYVPPSGGLFAAPFDLARHAVTGRPSRVLDRVASTTFRRGYSVSRDGTLVHLRGDPAASGNGEIPLLLVDMAGGVDTLRLPPGRLTQPRFAPDGRRIAYQTVERVTRQESDIYTYDLVLGTNTQITFEGNNDAPIWSPDGTRLLFRSERGEDGMGLFVKPADNSAPERRVLPAEPSTRFLPLQWLAGDLVILRAETSGNADLMTWVMDGGGEPEPYLEAPWGERDFALSPDGGLAAVVMTQGTTDIWLREFPRPEGLWRVTDGNHGAPRWSPDGGTLYTWRFGPGPDTLYATSIQRAPSVVVGPARSIFSARLPGGLPNSWDLHPDGDRFVVAAARTPPDDEAATGYLVTLNWFTELRALVGEGN